MSQDPSAPRSTPLASGATQEVGEAVGALRGAPAGHAAKANGGLNGATVLAGDPALQLEQLLSLPAGRRIEPLTHFAEALAAAGPGHEATRSAAAEALLELINGYAGNARQRLSLGVALSRLGDPRLNRPADPDYWVTVTTDEGAVLQVGRFLVTNSELRAWFLAGGADVDANWSEEGLAWRDSGPPNWLALASDPAVRHLVEDNQPAAGPSWWEAEAYARASGARLPTVDEYRAVVRGLEKRPYPWGSPFGDGNANTREEALGQPCAVGLYLTDRTPEGVCDLAGNMGHWLADDSGSRRMLHPGSWARPSMAAWAKALEMADPDTRSADMSFRLVRGG